MPLISLRLCSTHLMNNNDLGRPFLNGLPGLFNSNDHFTCGQCASQYFTSCHSHNYTPFICLFGDQFNVSSTPALWLTNYYVFGHSRYSSTVPRPYLIKAGGLTVTSKLPLHRHWLFRQRCRACLWFYITVGCHDIRVQA